MDRGRGLCGGHLKTLSTALQALLYSSDEVVTAECYTFYLGATGTDIRYWTSAGADVTFGGVRASGPLLPDDANTVSHLWVTGGALVDTIGANTWTETGSVPRVSAASVSPISTRSAEAIGPFSAPNYVTLSSSTPFGFLADFFFTFVFRLPVGGSDATGLLFKAGNPAGAGYEFVLSWDHGTHNGTVTFVYNSTSSSPNVAFTALPGETVIVSIGRKNTGKGGTSGGYPIGCDLVWQVNGGAVGTMDFGPWMLPAGAPAAVFGGGAGAPLQGAVLIEMRAEAATPLDAALAAVYSTQHTYSCSQAGIKRGKIDGQAGTSVDTMDLEIWPGSVTVGSVALMSTAFQLALHGKRCTMQRVYFSGGVPVDSVILFDGTCQDIKPGSLRLSLSVKSPMSKATEQIPSRVVQTGCSYALYGTACGATPITTAGTVGVGSTTSSVVAAAFTSSSGSNTQPGSWITFTSGALNGQQFVLRSVTAGNAVLDTPAPSAPVNGVTFTVLRNCDKSRATCRTVFSRIHVFPGFPDLPAEKVTAD